MKNTLEFRPEDLPLTIRFNAPEGMKEYVLLKTKQDRLMLQKPQGTQEPH
jgi:hypothetical protein